MKRPEKPTIIIPRTELGAQLDQAATLKAEMTDLLRELEQAATHKTIAKPGGWRHDPLGWLKRHTKGQD